MSPAEKHRGFLRRRARLAILAAILGIGVILLLLAEALHVRYWGILWSVLRAQEQEGALEADSAYNHRLHWLADWGNQHRDFLFQRLASCGQGEASAVTDSLLLMTLDDNELMFRLLRQADLPARNWETTLGTMALRLHREPDLYYPPMCAALRTCARKLREDAQASSPGDHTLERQTAVLQLILYYFHRCVYQEWDYDWPSSDEERVREVLELSREEQQ